MSAADTATVTIEDDDVDPCEGNAAPVASAGPDKSVSTGQSVSFSGGASTDVDGSIVSYSWTFGDGSSAIGLSVSHTYAAPGSYTARLTVTDSCGATGSDTVVVTVQNPASVNPTLVGVLPSLGDPRDIVVTDDARITKVFVKEFDALWKKLEA